MYTWGSVEGKAGIEFYDVVPDTICYGNFGDSGGTE
jgi:hypothetical protein